MSILEIVSIAFGIVGTTCAIVFGVSNAQRDTKKETKQDGKNDGIILTELGYIKAGVDDVKAEQREQRSINTQHSERITAVEESAKQAHKRLDRIQEQMNHEHDERRNP